MSCRIRAVEHRKCAAGLAGTHPGLQDRILLNKGVRKGSFLGDKPPFSLIFYKLYYLRKGY